MIDSLFAQKRVTARRILRGHQQNGYETASGPPINRVAGFNKNNTRCGKWRLLPLATWFFYLSKPVSNNSGTTLVLWRPFYGRTGYFFSTPQRSASVPAYLRVTAMLPSFAERPCTCKAQPCHEAIYDTPTPRRIYPSTAHVDIFP